MAVEKSGGGGGASSSSSSAASTVDRFLKIVLSWDYLRLVADSKVRSRNPPTRRTDRSAITPETLNLLRLGGRIRIRLRGCSTRRTATPRWPST